MTEVGYDNIVYLSLGSHDARAISGTCYLIETILAGDELLNKPPFFISNHRNIFWLEMVGQTPKSSLVFYSDYLRSQSLVDAQMKALPYTYPACKQPLQEITDFKHQLRTRLEKDRPDDLEPNIPVNFGGSKSEYDNDFPWFALKMLDKLKLRYPVEFLVSPEVHPLASLQIFEQLWSRRAYMETLSDQGFRRGDIKAATSFLKEHIIASAEYLRQRNAKIAKQLGQLLETSPDGLPTHLFVLIGDGHFNLSYYLKRLNPDILKRTRIVSRFGHESFFSLDGQIEDRLRTINQENDEGRSLIERLTDQLEIGIGQLTEEDMLKAILDRYVHRYISGAPLLPPHAIREDTDSLVSSAHPDQIRMLIKRMPGKDWYEPIGDLVRGWNTSQARASSGS